MWFVIGSTVIGLAAAALACIGVFAVAWGISGLTGNDLTDLAIWDSTGAVVGVFVLPVVAVVLAMTVAHGLIGGSRRILRDVEAEPVTDRDVAADVALQRCVNVVDGLSIGLGVERPELSIIDDPAPNALSVRWGKHRVIAVTRGLLELPRPEIEAVCAHELAHLHAVDARWMTAAETTMRRTEVAGTGILIVGIVIGALGPELDWFAPLLVGAAIGIVGLVAAAGAMHARNRIRREADTVADVAAVLLARDPASLGAVCARLVVDRRVVQRTSDRASAAWFELVRDPKATDDDEEGVVAAMKRRQRQQADPHTELKLRAEEAYREARIPFAWPADPWDVTTS